jgi:hypothetical protein
MLPVGSCGHRSSPPSWMQKKAEDIDDMQEFMFNYHKISAENNEQSVGLLGNQNNYKPLGTMVE